MRTCKKIGVAAAAFGLAVYAAAGITAAAQRPAANDAKGALAIKNAGRPMETDALYDAALRKVKGVKAVETDALYNAALKKVQSGKTTAGLELTVETYEHTFKTKAGRTYKTISYQYPSAAGGSAAAEQINSFYKKLRTKWKKAAKENLKEARNIVVNGLEADDERHYYDTVTCEITNNDGNYISVLQSGDEYSMGAHGIPYRISYIFDAETGKKVSAANILGMTKDQLNAKVRKLFLKKFDQSKDTDTFTFYDDREDVEKTLNKIDFNDNKYYLKNGKVRFYVDPYAVGPYVAGFIETAVKLQ